MAYTPTEWKTGNVITADKLNNMESGIVNANGSVFVVNFTRSESGKFIADKTFQEIATAAANGSLVVGVSNFVTYNNFSVYYGGATTYYVLSTCYPSELNISGGNISTIEFSCFLIDPENNVTELWKTIT